jgi:hypothetical protein
MMLSDRQLKMRTGLHLQSTVPLAMTMKNRALGAQAMGAFNKS